MGSPVDGSLPTIGSPLQRDHGFMAVFGQKGPRTARTTGGEEPVDQEAAAVLGCFRYRRSYMTEEEC
jgi:hypothetical protein